MPLPKDPIKREQALINMSLAHKRIPRSEEHCRNISESKKGELNPMYGKPGYWLGKHHSEEARQKQSKTMMGRTGFWKGTQLSKETCQKISLAHKGKSLSEEHKRKIGDAERGEKHYNWKGGTSFEPYCILFNREFKERSRAFYDYTCVECGTPQNGHKLHIHHVNFNKQSCCDSVPPLFVALCRSCHAKTQSPRKYWEQHFTEMIEGYYQGKCYLTKEEMIQIGGDYH